MILIQQSKAQQLGLSNMKIRLREEHTILLGIQPITGYHLQAFIGELSELMKMEV